MTSSLKSLRAGASSYPLAETALQSAEGALDNTRQLASQAYEKAGEKMRDLRHGAQELASKGLSTAADTAAVAQKQLGRYADATGRYVSDQPLKSALIAAAVGAVIAGVFIAARRRSRSNWY